MSLVPFAGDNRTRVLLAVIGLSAEGHRPYLDAIAARTGLHRSTVNNNLIRLKSDGLVDWEPGRSGTLHALVAVAGDLDDEVEAAGVGGRGGAGSAQGDPRAS